MKNTCRKCGAFVKLGYREQLWHHNAGPSQCLCPMPKANSFKNAAQWSSKGKAKMRVLVHYSHPQIHFPSLKKAEEKKNQTSNRGKLILKSPLLILPIPLSSCHIFCVFPFIVSVAATVGGVGIDPAHDSTFLSSTLSKIYTGRPAQISPRINTNIVHCALIRHTAYD